MRSTFSRRQITQEQNTNTIFCSCGTELDPMTLIEELEDVLGTDLHIYNLDAVPPVHVVWNHVDTDKLTTANSGTFTLSSAILSNQSC